MLSLRSTRSQIHRSSTNLTMSSPSESDPLRWTRPATPRNRGRDSGHGGDIGHARFGWAKPMGGCHLCSSAHACDLATFRGALFAGLGAAFAVVVVVLSTLRGTGIARLGAKGAKPVGELRTSAQKAYAAQAKVRTISAQFGTRGHCTVADTGVAAVFALLGTFVARFNTSFHCLMSHFDRSPLPAMQANVTRPVCRDRHRPRHPGTQTKKPTRPNTPKAFNHVGLLYNRPPGEPGCPLSNRPTTCIHLSCGSHRLPI